ncbi:MAG: SH3 domain-containing protein [Magnetospirillum sp.]|nr:SH3 domain-containing protein [Magnetospirillum sp.]
MRPGTVWLGLAIAILLTAGAASFLISLQSEQAAAPPSARAPVAPASPPGPVPAPVPGPVASAVLDVDSRADGYALAEWRRAQGEGGAIDAMALAGGVALPGRPLTDADVIELGGWAGDADLGLRTRFVVVAVCGRVVATPTVDMPRPDVAERVHPNLFASGWRARLAVKHLPRCADAAIDVLGPVGGFPFAIPLEGRRALDLAPAGGPAADTRGPAGLRGPPADPPALRRVVVQGQGSVNLRRCAGPACAAIGQLAAGAHMAILAEETSEWLLLAVPSAGRSGWIAKRLVRLD